MCITGKGSVRQAWLTKYAYLPCLHRLGYTHGISRWKITMGNIPSDKWVLQAISVQFPGWHVPILSIKFPVMILLTPSKAFTKWPDPKQVKQTADKPIPL